MFYVGSNPTFFNKSRAISSVGRAFRLHRNSRWFESVIAQNKDLMWNKTILILSLSLFFFIGEYFIISYFLFRKKETYYWMIFYFLQSLIILLFLHFNWGKNFFFLLLKDMNKNIIIRDPQDLLYLLMNSSFYLISIVSFWLLLFYLSLKITNLFRENEYLLYKILVFAILYSFILAILIFIYDLNSFHWEIFYQDKTFDFQPELTKWYFFYKGEFFDLLTALFFILLSYFLMLLSSNIFLSNTNLFYRLIPFLLLSCFSLYFLGGESLFRDFWLCFCSFFFSEILVYLKLFLMKVHHYKLKD